MLDIVDPHSEGVMPDEERTGNTIGFLAIHRHLRPEVPIAKMVRALFDRPLEMDEINAGEQPVQLWIGSDT